MRGLDSLNVAVQTQLGTTGYGAVNAIYNNITWLHTLAQHIPTLEAANANTAPAVELLAYKKHIKQVSENIDKLLELSQDVPSALSIAPRIKAFSDKIDALAELTEANEELSDELNENIQGIRLKFEGFLKSTRQEIESAMVFLKAELEKYYLAYQEGLAQSNEAIMANVYELQGKLANYDKLHEEHESLKAYVAYLIASDAITFAIHSNRDCDYEAAKDKIREAEKFGLEVSYLWSRLTGSALDAVDFIGKANRQVKLSKRCD